MQVNSCYECGRELDEDGKCQWCAMSEDERREEDEWERADVAYSKARDK